MGLNIHTKCPQCGGGGKQSWGTYEQDCNTCKGSGKAKVDTGIEVEEGKTPIVLQISNCRECPFFEKRRMYTADSFEEAYDWFCKKEDGKKIQGYVEWHEDNKIEIPDWCPIKLQ